MIVTAVSAKIGKSLFLEDLGPKATLVAAESARPWYHPCRMNIRAVVEYDKGTKAYAVYCPELPGCTSCGDTEAEALKNFAEAVGLFLEPSPIRLPKRAKVKELAL